MPPLLFAVGALAGLSLLLLVSPSAEAAQGYHPPVANRQRISSGYGWRVDPLTGARSLHEGLDLSVPVGTPVYAPWWGQVELVQRDGVGPGRFNGNAVFVRTQDHRLWAYLHLHGAAVQPGVAVRPGQLLGWSGATGRSTGPHLHLQVWDTNGQTLDPRRLYPPGTFA